MLTVSRLTAFILLALLLSFQYQIWIGPRSVSELGTMRERLVQETAANEQMQLQNQQLQAEVDDLVSGLETVEEKARYELNMVKADEIMVQYLE